MADGNSIEIASTSEVTGERSESTVELNVKTLDSQIYKFNVDKDMPVPLFKEKIANAIGVPVVQQRLIFRGKVLKDDHLLSEYHVEDGHTLHLIARQPSQPSPGTSSGENTGNSDNRGNDANAGAPRNRVGQVSHSVVLGTFNIGDQGEGIVPDVTRIIGAVLNSIGLGNQITTGGTSNVPPSNMPSSGSSEASQSIETEGTRGNLGGRNQTGNQVQPGQPFPSHVFPSLPQSLQFPLTGEAVPLPSLLMPIPDSLNTLSEFMNHMEQMLSLNGFQPNPSPTNVGDPPQVSLPSDARGLPTLEALNIVIRRAQQLLSGHAVAALSHIAGRLEGEGASADPVIRGQIQAVSVQVGLAMQHLGALFLELGRTILTLRMGQSPTESLVNAGPAVYISPSRPNPIMVQPFPLQTSPLLVGSAAAHANQGTLSAIGLVDAPRNVNIHIHAGTSLAPGAASVGSRENTGEGTHGEHSNGTSSGDSGPTQVLPVRNAVAAAVPSRSSAEPAGHVLSVLYPVHARSQLTNPGHSTPAQGSGGPISNTTQTGPGVSVSQPPSESFSLSPTVAEINTRIRNLVDNMRRENQAPSGQSDALTFHGLSIGSGASNNVGNHQQESMAFNEAREATVLGPVCNSEAEGQQPQPECHQFSSSEDTSASLSSKEASLTGSAGGSSCCPSGETTLSCKLEVAPEDASRSSQSNDPSESSKSVPLGLGLGGLQPKRRSKMAKSQGKDGSGTTSAPSVDQSQQTIASGQQVLQSLISQGSNANRTGANVSSAGQLPPVLGQIMESMPLAGQASNGQVDAASVMSQVLNSPALNGLLAGVSEQAGIGSPGVLRNMLEQFTQSPTMRNTLNQIAQQVESQDLGNMFSRLGSGQGGGMDLSRMVQQMMPIVSEALTRGSTHPESEPFHSVGPTQQPQYNERRPDSDSKSDDWNLEIDLQQAAQRIEHGDPPGDIFRSVVENAVRMYGSGNGSVDLVEELCSNEDLADEFMEMLHRNLSQQ